MTPIYEAQTQLLIDPAKGQGTVSGLLQSGNLVAQRGASIEMPNNGTE